MITTLLVVAALAWFVWRLPPAALRCASTEAIAVEALRIVRLRDGSRRRELRDIERELARRGIRFVRLLKAERRQVLREKFGHLQALRASGRDVLSPFSERIQAELSDELVAIDLALMERGARA